MGFRKPKSDQHIAKRAWQQWLSKFEPQLKAIGLPSSVTTSESHWIDFLQNGYLEMHPELDDGFEFNCLSADQMKTLLVVLESSPDYVGEPMVGWLRHRVGEF